MPSKPSLLELPISGLLLALALGCAAPDTGNGVREDDVPVVVQSVAMDERLSPVVILEERSGLRSLPIWIGLAEARSIAVEIQDEGPEAVRPNSHDLAKRVIHRLDAEVVRVVVTELRRGTYYALLSLQMDGEILQIDSRPSDAIAIALRAGAPIFVREPLFDSAATDGDPDAARQEI